MIGKFIALVLAIGVAYFCFAVYAPPAPFTSDDGVEHPYISGTPTNLHEACIMIGELRRDLNAKSKALKEARVAIAPAALGDYISMFARMTSDVPQEEMLNAINMTTQQVEEEIAQILRRSGLDRESKMRSALAEVAEFFYVRCRYNLAFPEHEKMRAVQTKLAQATGIDDGIFSREMTFIYVKTWKPWSFANSFSLPLNLDNILEGLRQHGIAKQGTDTAKAVRVLYDSTARDIDS